MLELLRSDGRLVREAREGTAPALEELVRRYQRYAHAVARAHLPRQADPEDTVQEAFYQALRDLPALRDGERFGPWFLAIVRNVARKEARRSSRFDPLEVEPADLRPADSLEWIDLRARLWEEVHRLPPQLREAVLIYYHQGGCVRAVARAQGVSAALARKRLQLGRDRLRENLWKRLGDEIRDLLPSARRWKQKARQATLLILAASPTIEASAAPVAAVSGIKLITTTLGVMIMAKKSFLLTALVLVLLGASFWAGKMVETSASAPAPGIQFMEKPASHARFLQLQAAAEKSASRAKDLETQNQALLEKVARLSEAPAPAGGQPAMADVDPGAAIDWSSLEGLMARNADILPGAQAGPSSKEDDVRMREVIGELMKLSSRAKAVSPLPFFHEDIFNDLTAALFTGPLHLSAEQKEKLREINRNIFAALPEHPEETTRAERHRLREVMARQLWEGVEGMLDEEQKERWEPARSFAQMAFRDGGQFDYGLDNSPESFEGNVRHLYTLEKTQLEMVRPLAEAYLGDARRLLERYGPSQSEIEKLPFGERMKLDDELLELQMRFERQIDPHLSEEQKRAIQEKEFTMLRFGYGRKISMNGYMNYF